MKLPKTLILAVCTAALSGCNTTSRPSPFDAGPPTTGELIRGASLDKAIIVQRTLYPYHFVVDGNGLNELGERDLHVLAAYFRQNAGSLQVRRGSANQALYDARVKAVMAALVDAGVSASQVKVGDGLPGGDGMSSERVVVIQAKDTALGQTAVGVGVGAGSGGAGSGSSGSSAGGMK